MLEQQAVVRDGHRDLLIVRDLTERAKELQRQVVVPGKRVWVETIEGNLARTMSALAERQFSEMTHLPSARA